MNFRQLTVVMAMSAVVATSAAHAASSADYLAEREKTTVTPLQTTNELVNQYASHAGQFIELDGVVSDIVPNGKHTTFLLRIDPQQNLLVAAQQDDADIVLGAKLRVLARVPASGELLEGMCVTNGAQNLPVQAATPPAKDAQPQPLAKSAVEITAATPEASPKAQPDATAVTAVTVAEVTPVTTGAVSGHRRHHGRRFARKAQTAGHVAANASRTFSQKVQLYASKNSRLQSQHQCLDGDLDRDACAVEEPEIWRRSAPGLCLNRQRITFQSESRVAGRRAGIGAIDARHRRGRGNPCAI